MTQVSITVPNDIRAYLELRAEQISDFSPPRLPLGVGSGCLTGRNACTKRKICTTRGICQSLAQG
jgi:hypothetical protein